MSPAYDLVYNAGFNGEHATMIDGEGKNPTEDNMLAVASKVGLELRKAKEILGVIRKIA